MSSSFGVDLGEYTQVSQLQRGPREGNRSLLYGPRSGTTRSYLGVSLCGAMAVTGASFSETCRVESDAPDMSDAPGYSIGLFDYLDRFLVHRLHIAFYLQSLLMLPVTLLPLQ